MASHISCDQGGDPIMQPINAATSWLEPSESVHACQFADEVRQLLGDDSEPDALFFEESWSIGTSGALVSWQQRQLCLAERDAGRGVPGEFDSLRASAVLFGNDWTTEHFLSIHAALIAQRRGVGPSRQSSGEHAAPAESTYVQQQTMPGEKRDETQATAGAMTEHRACCLLGVTVISTRDQVRTAYRRMVSQWHPDRLERGTQDMRLLATEQMSAINEAYRLLRRGLFEESRFAHPV